MIKSEYLGERTIRKMAYTKWFAYARFIDDILYNRAETDEIHLQIPRKVYLGEKANKVELAMDGDKPYWVTEKALRELMDELEGLALKEVT